MGKEKSASFGQMVRAALGHGVVDGVQAHSQGGRFALPLERAAVISAENIAGGRERILDGVEWLRGDSDASPILSRLMLVPTATTRGKIASGQVLGATSMQPESGSAAYGRGVVFPTVPAPAKGDLFRFLSDATVVAVDEAEAALTAAKQDETYRFTGTAWQRQAAMFGEHDFDLTSVIEAKSEISLQLAVQTADNVLDDVLEAHRLGLADRLLEQVLSGDGTGNNLSGVAGSTGIGSATISLRTVEAMNRLLTGRSRSKTAAGGRLSWRGVSGSTLTHPLGKRRRARRVASRTRGRAADPERPAGATHRRGPRGDDRSYRRLENDRRPGLVRANHRRGPHLNSGRSPHHEPAAGRRPSHPAEERHLQARRGLGAAIIV